VKLNRAAIDEIRELFRRSGGTTPSLRFPELTAYYRTMLDEQDINSLREFDSAKFPLRLDDFVPPARRKQLWSLPPNVSIHGKVVEIDYGVEEYPEPPTPAKPGDPERPAVYGIARLRLPEKLARTLTEEDLPELDRPLRFIVTRGERGAVRADTLEELQDLLEGPWTPTEGASRPEAKRPEKKAPPKRGQAHAGGFKRGGGRRGRK
jgi:hypothetical protein